MANGIFITFEGSEGCGKSTQVERLAARLSALPDGRKLLTLREPGGTALGEEIRHLLKRTAPGWTVVPEAELLLFAASRAQLVRETIAPTLAVGGVVLCDRFLDSTTVYQGVARRLEVREVAAINDFAAGPRRPDLTFLLDLPSVEALARLQRRSSGPTCRPTAWNWNYPLSTSRSAPATSRSRNSIPGVLSRSTPPCRPTILSGRFGRFLPSVSMAFAPTVALDYLRRAHEGDRLAHAYLLVGAEPASELARQLASLVIHAPAAAVFTHPDVHLVEPESKSRRIVVEQMRDLENSLRLRASTAGGRKVGIVREADRLQPQAANAFLKTLEEPPAGSLLLLLSAQPEALMETILSRCIKVTVQAAPGSASSPLSAEETRLLDLLGIFERTRSAADAVSAVSVAYRLLRDFTGLLAAVRARLQSQAEDSLEREEARYAQTTDGTWLAERETYHKSLTEARYVAERARLIAVLSRWWGDVLRRQTLSGPKSRFHAPPHRRCSGTAGHPG